MPPKPLELLHRLGNGESIAAVRAAAGLSEPEFNDWWQSELVSRVPPAGGQHRCPVRSAVQVERDRADAVVRSHHTILAGFVSFGYP